MLRRASRARVHATDARARLNLPVLACSLLVALVASCADEPTGPGSERPFVIDASGLGPQSQTVGIFDRGDRPVTDAEVTVNSVLLAHAGDGIYMGDLREPRAAGSALTLEARIGDQTVVGTGTVPEALSVSGPADRSAFELTDTIPVAWASATPPDHVEVIARWRVGETELSVSFPAPDGASSLGIPASDLPRGIDVALEVVAYNDGVLSGPIDPESRMRIRSEGAGSPVVRVGSPLSIRGYNLGAKSQRIVISYEGERVTDAEVTVNGVPLRYTDTEFYEGELPDELPVGAPLTLEVRLGLTTVRATGNVPETPVLTAPATGTTFQPEESITVAWTSGPDANGFEVSYGWMDGASVVQHFFYIFGPESSHEFAASELPPGAEVTIEVIAFDHGTFTGSAEPDSRMGIASKGKPSTVITIGP